MTNIQNYLGFRHWVLGFIYLPAEARRAQAGKLGQLEQLKNFNGFHHLPKIHQLASSAV